MPTKRPAFAKRGDGMFGSDRTSWVEYHVWCTKCSFRHVEPEEDNEAGRQRAKSRASVLHDHSTCTCCKGELMVRKPKG